MSVSIVGPAISFSNQQSAKKNHSNCLNHTPQPVSFQSINQSSNLKVTKSFLESSLEENHLNQNSPNHKPQKIIQKPRSSQKQQSKQSLEQKIIENSSFNERYHYIMSEAQNYLLQFANTSQVLHRQFEVLVNMNVFLRFTPEPKTELGIQLFKNGLFLIALVKLVTRSSQSPFIVCYIYEYLEGAYAHLIEKNSYVFRNECQRAKKNYQAALEKKYTEMIITQKEHNHKEDPIRRKNLSENCFFAEKINTKDSYSQVSPQKANLIQQINQKEPILIVTQTRIPLQAPISKFQQINQKEPILIVTQTKIPLQAPISKPKKVEEKKHIQKQEQIMIKQIPKPQVTPSKKHLEKLSPKKSQQTSKNSRKKQIPQVETSSEQVPKVDNKSNELKLKKNIEDLRNSLGSSGKKHDTQDMSNDQASKFSELYMKYRKIRENKKSDLPIENSSVKRSIVEQALKADNQDSVPEKKPTKKVVFTDEVIINNPIENEQSNQQDLGRRKKRKKSRSKKDDSIEKSEQEDQTAFKKKINSKK